MTNLQRAQGYLQVSSPLPQVKPDNTRIHEYHADPDRQMDEYAKFSSLYLANAKTSLLHHSQATQGLLL